MKRILAAVDGSAAALRAAAFAADLAGKYAAELVLLTVAPELTCLFAPGVAEYARIEGIQDALSQYGNLAAQAVLDEASMRVREECKIEIATALAVGDPAAEIIAAAKDRQVDLIVVGSRGRSRLVGLLLGSVAQKVISLAPCPVTVIR